MPGVDKKKTSAENVSLVEVGPRCCMNPIKVFSGSFGGPVLYDNPAYVSPNKASIACAGATLSGSALLQTLKTEVAGIAA